MHRALQTTQVLKWPFDSGFLFPKPHKPPKRLSPKTLLNFETLLILNPKTLSLGLWGSWTVDPHTSWRLARQTSPPFCVSRVDPAEFREPKAEKGFGFRGLGVVQV